MVKNGLKWLKMYFKHNLLFFWKKNMENAPDQTPSSPECGIFHPFFLTGSLREVINQKIL